MLYKIGTSYKYKSYHNSFMCLFSSLFDTVFNYSLVNIVNNRQALDRLDLASIKQFNIKELNQNFIKMSKGENFDLT